MPTLPRYDSQRALTTQRPGAIQQGAGAEKEMIAKAAMQVSDIAIKWQAANNAIQGAYARSVYEPGLLDIANQHYDKPEEYAQEIEKLKSEAMKGISNNAYAQQIKMEFDHKANIAMVKINNQIRQRAIELTRTVSIPKSIDGYSRELTLAASPSELKTARAKADMFLNEQVGAGVITEAEKEKFINNMEKAAAEMDIYTDPVSAKKKIEAGVYELKPKEKKDLIKLADSEISIFQDKKSVELAQVMVDPTISSTAKIETIKAAHLSGEISTKTATAYIDVVESRRIPKPKGDEVKKPKLFIEALEAVISDKADVQDVMNKATEAWGNKVLDDDQYAWFMKEAQKMIERQSKGKKQSNSFITAIKSAIDRGKAAGRSTILGELITRMNKGQDPESAATQSINNSRKEDRPDIINFPEKGQLMIDAQGNKAIVYPDGRIEEVE